MINRPDFNLAFLGIGVTVMLMLIPITLDMAARWFLANSVMFTWWLR
jgi:hypothetical protein